MAPRNDRPSSGATACRACGATVTPEAAFCPQCGTEDPSGRRASYCGDCGAKFAPGDDFCSNCGASRDGPAGSRRSESDAGQEQFDREARRAFRRRVQAHLDDGWELERDYGSRVVLVDRDIGSIPIHVVLLLFTGGFGNLLYGWYRYSHEADRRYLSVEDIEADGQERSRSDGRTAAKDRETTSGTARTIATYGTSLAVFLFGLAFIVTGNAVGIGIGIVLVTVALFLLPQVRDRIGRRHELTAFGRRRTVDQRVIESSEDHDEPCVVCAEEFDRGLLRRRRDETLFAGVPVRTHRRQYNHYCAACARSEILDRPSPEEEGIDDVLRSLASEDQGDSDREDDRSGPAVDPNDSDAEERNEDAEAIEESTRSIE